MSDLQWASCSMLKPHIQATCFSALWEISLTWRLRSWFSPSLSVSSAALIALGKSCLFANNNRTASRSSSSWSCEQQHLHSNEIYMHNMETCLHSSSDAGVGKHDPEARSSSWELYLEFVSHLADHKICKYKFGVLQEIIKLEGQFTVR